MYSYTGFHSTDNIVLLSAEFGRPISVYYCLWGQSSLKVHVVPHWPKSKTPVILAVLYLKLVLFVTH